jgi:choline dehydrogenase-like flavoprotein
MGLFHPSCTVKMGTADDSMSCVDRDLKVFGLQNLRVADISVTPLLPRYVYSLPITITNCYD